MNYSELLNSIMCKRVIIFEDDFNFDFKKESIIYDITRMNQLDRQSFLDELNIEFPQLVIELQEFLEYIDIYFNNIDWNNKVPRGNIIDAFDVLNKINPGLKENLLIKYNAINSKELELSYSIAIKYVIGVSHPSCFDSLFNDFILSENRAKSIRLYTDFTSNELSSFKNDLKTITDDCTENSIVCIIDNNLKGTNRANEILDVIVDSPRKRRNIIGTIFSSKEKFETIDERLYFAYTTKNSPEKLKSSIAKSAYNYFIYKLQTETITTLDNAFKKALSNKNIAYYLSQKAFEEGASEYKIILNWIKLLCSPCKSNNTIKQLISLSKVINSLDEDEDVQINQELSNYNTLEAFDYTINDYLLPIASGDIFTNSKGDWFVLIGQDCDMAWRGNGKPPRNTVAELLPAKVVPQHDIKKIANDLEKVTIGSFKKTEEDISEFLQIFYRNRHFVTNDIINLCSFNMDGNCSLPINERLSDEKKKLLPHHLINYYEELQNYFKSVKVLQCKAPAEFNKVITGAYSPRIVSYDNMTESEGNIQFDLRRVCRLTHSYVFYIYKLFLEYRGRQPFESINLIRTQELTLPITTNGSKTSENINFKCILSPKNCKLHKMDWIVEAAEINRIINLLGYDANINDQQFLSKSQTEILVGEKKIILTKKENQVDFTVN